MANAGQNCTRCGRFCMGDGDQGEPDDELCRYCRDEENQPPQPYCLEFQVTTTVFRFVDAPNIIAAGGHVHDITEQVKREYPGAHVEHIETKEA